MLRCLVFGALAFARLLSACGGDGDGTPTPTEPVSSPSVSPTVTAQPSPSPEASPGASSPTPGATEQPTQQPTPVPITFESITSPVDQGEEVSATVQTVPDTPCFILVIRGTDHDPDYIGVEQPFEVMKLPGLEAAVSDESGGVSWRWRLEADTTPAKWGVTVFCGLGGGNASSELEVVERQ
jgi:hypothetical protein